MSGERPYPPSDQKLAKLRSEGVFPRTPELFFFAVTGALLLSILYFDRSGASGVVALFEDQFRRGELAGGGREAAELWSKQSLRILVGAVARFLVAPLVITATFVLCMGLFQSRFLLLSPRFELGRIVSGLSGWYGQIGARSRGALYRIVQLVVLFALAYLALLSLVSILTGSVGALVPTTLRFDSQLVNGDTQTIARGIEAQSEVLTASRAQLVAAREHFQGILAMLVGFAALLALVCRFSSVLAFRRAQGMSREELQAELRESEAAPEMKGAVRDLRSLE